MVTSERPALRYRVRTILVAVAFWGTFLAVAIATRNRIIFVAFVVCIGLAVALRKVRVILKLARENRGRG